MFFDYMMSIWYYLVEKWEDLPDKFEKIWRIKLKRPVKHFYQRSTRGFDDSETWGLDYTIAKFALPRLVRFKELAVGTVLPQGFTDNDEWEQVLDMMIYAMKSIIKDNDAIDWEDIDWEDVETGLDLFGKYFRTLWW